MHKNPAETITRKQADLLLFAHIFKTLTRFLEQGMLLIFLMHEKQVLQIKKMWDKKQKMKVNVT